MNSVHAENNSAADKEARLEQLRAEIQLLQTHLQTDYSQKGSLESQLRQRELAVAQHSSQLKKLGQQLRTQQKKLAQLRHDKQQQTQRLSEHQDALAQQMRSSYTMGRQGTLKILLSSRTPADIGRTLTYYNYFNRARAQRIIHISDGLAQLAALETTIARETSELQTIVTQQQQQQQQRETEYQQRRQVLVKLQAQIGSKEQQLKSLINDKEQLSRLLEELHKALSDIPPDVGNLKPFTVLKGRLSQPADGKFTRRFGSSRGAGNLRWQGVTIDSEAGTDVRAIYHGRIAFADWLRNFGLLIIIDHGDGYMSLYGHNQALFKDVGEWVDQGDVIASVGDSGGQASAGLYFEIRHNGTPLNPAAWLQAAK